MARRVWAEGSYRSIRRSNAWIVGAARNMLFTIR